MTGNCFGLNSASPWGLKKRLFAELVERLSALEFVQDKENPEVYHFISSARGMISVRISYRKAEKDFTLIVEFLDLGGHVLLREEIDKAGFNWNYQHHPLAELAELVKEKEERSLDEIKRINHLLSILG